MKVNFKEIESEQLSEVSEIFGINLFVFRNYLKCFGAFLRDEIIGILLLIEGDENSIRIRVFQVLPLFRGNHIGSMLLKLAEDYSGSIRSRKIFVKYNDTENDLEKCNRFFIRNNWETVKYTHTRFCFKKENFGKNFISRFYDPENTILNGEITCLFCNELSEKMRNRAKEQSEKMFSNGLLPFSDLDLMNKRLSVFAFLNDNLIAWSVANLLKHNEISIRSTFVVNKYRNSGLGMYLWYLIFCKTNENQDFNLIKWISFDFQKDDDRLRKLYTLLFGRILEQSTDYYISEKILT